MATRWCAAVQRRRTAVLRWLRGLGLGEDDDGVQRDAGKSWVRSAPAFTGGGVVEVWMEARWRRRLRRGRSRRTAAGNNKGRGHEAAQRGGETDGRGLGCRSSLQSPEMEDDGGGRLGFGEESDGLGAWIVVGV